MRLAREILRRHGEGADLHPGVAERFVAEGTLPVLDVGCGEGELHRHLPRGAWAGVDASPTMVARAPAGTQVAQAESLPFTAGSLGSAATPSAP